MSSFVATALSSRSSPLKLVTALECRIAQAHQIISLLRSQILFLTIYITIIRSYSLLRCTHKYERTAMRRSQQSACNSPQLGRSAATKSTAFNLLNLTSAQRLTDSL